MIKKERIMSYCFSRKIDDSDLESISAASGGVGTSVYITYKPESGWDAHSDINMT